MIPWNRLFVVILPLLALLGLGLAVTLTSAGADSAGSPTRRVAQAALDGTLYLADESPDSNSGWAVAGIDAGRTSYANGTYRVGLLRPNAPVMPLAPAPACADYSLTVQMRWATDATAGAYGVFFGAQDDGADAYLFLLYADAGEFSLLRRAASGQVREIIGRTPHAAIESGQNANRVHVERSGAAIRATINGQAAIEIEDQALLGQTMTGLIAVSHASQPVADAHFDRFYLSATGCDVPEAFALTASVPNSDTTPPPPTATPTGTWTPPPPTLTPTPGPTPTLPPLPEKLYLPLVE